MERFRPAAAAVSKNKRLRTCTWLYVLWVSTIAQLGTHSTHTPTHTPTHLN